MEQFVFNGRGTNDRTGHERIAMRNIRYAINWIVGGYFNCIQDGIPEYLPASYASFEQEVYDSAMENRYAPGCEWIGRAPREMRFAGADFCRAYIKWKLSRDADTQEIAKVAHWAV